MALILIYILMMVVDAKISEPLDFRLVVLGFAHTCTAAHTELNARQQRAHEATLTQRVQQQKRPAAAFPAWVSICASLMPPLRSRTRRSIRRRAALANQKTSRRAPPCSTHACSRGRHKRSSWRR